MHINTAISMGLGNIAKINFSEKVSANLILEQCSIPITFSMNIVRENIDKRLALDILDNTYYYWNKLAKLSNMIMMNKVEYCFFVELP